MGLKTYFRSFLDLPVTDRHSAQLAGIAEAYFPNSKNANQRDLRAVHALLRDDESVVAGFPCLVHDDAQSWSSSTGLLLFTDQRLLDTRAGVMHWHPVVRDVELEDIELIELIAEPQRWPKMLCTFPNGSAAYTFVRGKFLPVSVRATIARVAGSVPLEDGWPSDAVR